MTKDLDGDQGEHPEYGRPERAPTHPMPLQPIEIASDGVVRFRENRIVRWLLDAGPFDMNQIAMLPGISNAERMQFAQLIGYSVSGAGDLSYFDMETCDLMDDEVDKVLAREKEHK